LGQILPNLYGKASVELLNYDVASKSFIAKAHFPKLDLHTTISISIVASKGQDFRDNFSNVKVYPVYNVEDSKVFLEKITLKYKNKKYTAVFTDKYFKFSQPKLTLAKNYIESQLSNEKSSKEYMLANKLFDNDLEKLQNSTKKVSEDSHKWALVIGIQKYRYSADISHASRSATRFSKVLNHALGVPKSNIYAIMDEDATGTIIKRRIKQMLHKVKKGDTVYFYYNGHGVPVPSLKNEPYILTSDGSVEYVQDDSYFALKNIYKTLTDSKAKKVVAFVDSCFSGGTDGKALIEGVAAARVLPKSVGFNKRKMSIMTAGQGHQYSNGYDKKGHRLFSYFLMKNLLEGERDMTQLFNKVSRHTTQKSFELYGDLRRQEPSFEGKITSKID
jgi:hypothetical protein